MGRPLVECLCGWRFTVEPDEQGLATCPSCHKGVHIPHSLPQPLDSVPHRPKYLYTLIIASGAAILIGLVALILMMSGAPPRDPDAKAQKLASRVPDPVEITPEPLPPPLTPSVVEPVPSAPPIRFPTPEELHASLERLLALSNMAGLVYAVLHNEGKVDEGRDIEKRLYRYDEEIQGIQKALGGGVVIPTHFQLGDELAAFGNYALAPSSPALYARNLRAWLGVFKGHTALNVRLTRDHASRQFIMQFRDNTKELTDLLTLLGLSPPLAVADAPAAPKSAQMTAELLASVQDHLKRVHPAYVKALPARDGSRLEKLLKERAGSPDDAEFLKSRFLSDFCNRALDEYSGLSVRMADLEPKVMAAAAADVVILNDGRRIEGKVEEETIQHVKLRGRLGTVTFLKTDVKTIERGKGGAAEFQGRYGVAREKLPELESLLQWCREKNLGFQMEMVTIAILLIQPTHERARFMAGMGPLPSTSSSDGDAVLVAGRITWRGKNYTPEELQSQLKAQGFVMLDGLWHEKVSRTYKIDNLYRDESKMVIIPQGAAIAPLQAESKGTVYDYRLKAWVPKTSLVTVARAFMSGELHVGLPDSTRIHIGTVLLEIESPGPVIECRVRAVGQVLETGGYLAVSVASSTEDPSPRLLYTINTPTTNNNSFEVGDKVRGLRKFYIRAEMRKSGAFLVSDRNDTGVLDVKYSHGRPLDHINALLNLKPK